MENGLAISMKRDICDNDYAFLAVKSSQHVLRLLDLDVLKGGKMDYDQVRPGWE